MSNSKSKPKKPCTARVIQGVIMSIFAILAIGALFSNIEFNSIISTATLCGGGLLLATAGAVGIDGEEAVINKLTEKFNNSLEEFKKSNPTLSEDQVKSIINDCFQVGDKKGVAEYIKSVNEAIIKLEALVEKTNGIDTNKKAKSINEALVNAYKSLKPEQINNLMSGKETSLSLNVKADPITVLTSMHAATTTSIPIGLSEVDPGITPLARRQPFLRQICNVRGTIKRFVTWVEQLSSSGDAAMTSEGATKPQSSFAWKDYAAEVTKIPVWTKVSKEALDDVESIRQAIDDDLIYKINNKLDTQLMSGTGTMPQMKGILASAQNFAAGTFAGTVEKANILDVLRIAVNQIEIEEFMPNYILMHPSDVAKIDLEKTTEGMYIMPPFTTANGATISGLPIVKNTGVDIGTFIVGDFTKAHLRIREEITFQLGYQGTDFVDNLITVLAEMRAVSFIKTNEVKAFVKGTFSTAISAILKSGS